MIARRLLRTLGCTASLLAVLLSAAGVAAQDGMPDGDAPYPPQEERREPPPLDEAFEDAPPVPSQGEPDGETSESEATPGRETPGVQPAESVPESGWTPSLGIGADVQWARFEGAVASDVRGAFTGSRDFVSTNPVVRAELATPVLLDLPGRPRLFAHGAWQWGWHAIEEERFVIEEGNPGDVRFEPSTFPTEPPPELAGGQGSTIDLRIRDGWYVGLGTDWATPLFGLDFHLRPSVDYYQQDVKYTAAVRNAICEITIPNPGVGRRCVQGTQQVQTLDATKSDVLRAIGPRFGVDVDLARRGPIGFSMFVEGFVYWFVEDPSVRFTGQSTTVSGVFEIDSDPYLAGGSVGMRISWRGY